MAVLRNREDYSLTTRGGDERELLSLNMKSTKFIRRLYYAVRLSLQHRLNADMVHLMVDLQRILQSKEEKALDELVATAKAMQRLTPVDEAELAATTAETNGS